MSDLDNPILQSCAIYTSPVVYNDCELAKSLITIQNKHKSGVYMWTNKTSGKRYVGSSVNLSNRFYAAGAEVFKS